MYSKPTLIKIEAQCGLDKLSPCSREGGVPITLHGANFGPQDATAEVILVGGGQKMTACNDTAHNEESPHEVLTCILPAGRLSRQVMVITASGTSSTEATIHYQRCAAGSHQDKGTGCVACEPGRHRSAEQLELTECILCNGNVFLLPRIIFFLISILPTLYIGVKGIAINNGTDCQPCPAFSSLMQDSQCGCKAVAHACFVLVLFCLVSSKIMYTHTQGYMFVSSDNGADVGEFGADIGRGRCQQCPSGAVK